MRHWTSEAVASGGPPTGSRSTGDGECRDGRIRHREPVIFAGQPRRQAAGRGTGRRGATARSARSSHPRRASKVRSHAAARREWSTRKLSSGSRAAACRPPMRFEGVAERASGGIVAMVRRIITSAEIRKRIVGKRSIWRRGRTRHWPHFPCRTCSRPSTASAGDARIAEGGIGPDERRRVLGVSVALSDGCAGPLARSSGKQSPGLFSDPPQGPRRGCPPAPRQRRAGRDRRKMGLRHEGLHQVGMPGCMTRSQQNFQTSDCSIQAQAGLAEAVLAVRTWGAVA